MRFKYSAAMVLPVVACMALICGCPVAGGGGPGNENENGNENVNVNDNAGGGGVGLVLPGKNIDLSLIGVHDPESDNYDGNCIGCHGDRTDEVALDGVTPMAHSTMLSSFGEGNDRCTSCHTLGPDFLASSAAALREQVDVTTCTACHGVAATPPFYAK